MHGRMPAPVHGERKKVGCASTEMVLNSGEQRRKVTGEPMWGGESTLWVSHGQGSAKPSLSLPCHPKPFEHNPHMDENNLTWCLLPSAPAFDKPFRKN